MSINEKLTAFTDLVAAAAGFAIEMLGSYLFPIAALLRRPLTAAFVHHADVEVW